jgi:formiminotetrahydrofolate cyclodeaminase
MGNEMSEASRSESVYQWMASQVPDSLKGGLPANARADTVVYNAIVNALKGPGSTDQKRTGRTGDDRKAG